MAVQTPSVRQKRSSVSTNVGMGALQTLLIGGLDQKSRTFPALFTPFIGWLSAGPPQNAKKNGVISYQC
jgi:hypothetical protein